jgi:hypothetical protein
MNEPIMGPWRTVSAGNHVEMPEKGVSYYALGAPGHTRGARRLLWGKNAVLWRHPVRLRMPPAVRGQPRPMSRPEQVFAAFRDLKYRF